MKETFDLSLPVVGEASLKIKLARGLAPDGGASNKGICLSLRVSPRAANRGRWIPTRSATPSTALVPQRKVGFPIPNPRLLLGFQRTKTARREGISNPFSDARGFALRPRTQGLLRRDMAAELEAAGHLTSAWAPINGGSTQRSPSGGDRIEPEGKREMMITTPQGAAI